MTSESARKLSIRNGNRRAIGLCLLDAEFSNPGRGERDNELIESFRS